MTLKRVTATAAAAVLGLALLPASPASADPALVVCTMTFIGDYDPPLTNSLDTFVEVDATGELTACTGTGGVTGGTVTATGGGMFGCVGGTMELTQHIVWDTDPPQSSTAELDITSIVGGSPVFTGTITDGLFQGATTTLTTPIAVPDEPLAIALCILGLADIDHSEGIGTQEIVQLS